MQHLHLYMKHQFTTHDLIRFMYNEVTFLEKAAIEKALQADTSLIKEFEQLQHSHDTLDNIEMQPSVTSIQNILSYSSSSRYETEFM